MDPESEKNIDFYACSNNGVTALMPAEAYEELLHRRSIIAEGEKDGKPVVNIPPARPIFTFSDSPNLKPFVTGTKQDMSKLLIGYEVTRGSIWVPFSNMKQWGTKEERETELLFRTSLNDVLNYFSKTLSFSVR